MDRTILIVEDEYKIIEFIKAYLERDGYKVIIAKNGEEGLQKFKEESPSLIILDLMLPGISGEDVCREIKKTSDTPIIMLTAKVQEEDILNGFYIGADDYVTKPFSPKQLVARVNAILKRTLNVKKYDYLLFNEGHLKINEESFEVIKDGVLVEVTPSEFKILLTLAKNPKRVFTRAELLDKISDEEADVYDRIIDSHIKNLRSKIEDNTRNPIYLITVYGIGYKFGGRYENIKS